MRGLALALGTRFAFVSRFSADNRHVHVLAFWNGTSVDEDVSYDIAGTPCAEILNGDIVAYDRGVSERYPAERELGAESYLAIPLQTPDGRILGHLAVIHVTVALPSRTLMSADGQTQAASLLNRPRTT